MLGVLFGAALHTIYGDGNPVLRSIGWFDLVGRLCATAANDRDPLFASILSAGACASSLGKIGFLTIGLLFTTAIAALIGIGLTNLFGLTAEAWWPAQEMARLQVIQGDYAGKVMNIPQLLLSFVPANPFADLARASRRRSSAW